MSSPLPDASDPFSISPSGFPSSSVVTLAPTTVYYLRKLLQQNLDRLTSVVASGAGMRADPLSDLNAVLSSLYLDDREMATAVQQLEYGVLTHQTITKQGAKYRQELRTTEEKIFWLLGYKLKEQNQRGSILIVDDEMVNMRLLTTALRKYGFDPVSAENGMVALKLAPDVQPELILLDIMLPGIDGYEVCKRLKADPQTQEIPVIFISTCAQSLDKVKGFQMGAADYITKPIDLDEMLVRIAHQLQIRDLQRRLIQQNVLLQKEVKERRQAESRYRLMFEQAIEGMFQSTANGRYLNANPALAQLYGYGSPAELMTAVNNIGQALYVDSQRRAQFVAYMQQHETLVNFKSQVYCKDGSTLWISENVRRIHQPDGTLAYYQGTVRVVEP